MSVRQTMHKITTIAELKDFIALCGRHGISDSAEVYVRTKFGELKGISAYGPEIQSGAARTVVKPRVSDHPEVRRHMELQRRTEQS